MKKFLTMVLALSFVLSLTITNVSASEQPSNSIDYVETIGPDGDLVRTYILEGETDIPIYATADDDLTDSLTNVATLHYTRSGKTVSFEFWPTPSLSWRALGFSGTFSGTNYSGLSIGSHYYSRVFTGSLSTGQSQFTTILVGRYYTMGYADAIINQGRFWY